MTGGHHIYILFSICVKLGNILSKKCSFFFSSVYNITLPTCKININHICLFPRSASLSLSKTLLQEFIQVFHGVCHFNCQANADMCLVHRIRI